MFTFSYIRSLHSVYQYPFNHSFINISIDFYFEICLSEDVQFISFNGKFINANSGRIVPLLALCLNVLCKVPRSPSFDTESSGGFKDIIVMINNTKLSAKSAAIQAGVFK